MDRFVKADRVICDLIRRGVKEFALFPFGEQGMFIKRILNERYGIKEKYIIDNTTLQLLKKSNAQGTFRSIISLQTNPYERE